MAQIVPSLLKIKNSINPPSEADLYLLQRLEKGLSDEYKVYYKPRIGGYYADIVVYKEKYGFIIIKTSEDISPDVPCLVSLLLSMKNKFASNDIDYNKDLLKYKVYKLASDYNKKLKENLFIPNPASFIKTAIYFHNLDVSYIRTIKYNTNTYDIKLWGSEDVGLINDIINGLKTRSIFFEKTISAIKLQLNPSLEKVELGSRIVFNEQQSRLTKVSYPEERKISGKAGSGKSLVLAKKAINAYLETGQDVLILCFNITLVNYIKLQIRRLIDSDIEDKFYIAHFHDFMNTLRIKYGFNIEDEGDALLFNKLLGKFNALKNEDKYKTILIDEGQDFHYEWFRFLKEKVLIEGGSYSIFGDPKQNIYEVEQDNDINNKKIIRTNILGRWNELKQGYRFGNTIKRLSISYQKKFLLNYELLDEDNVDEINLLDNQDYVYLDSSILVGDLNSEVIFEKIKYIIKFLNEKHQVNQNDIAILGCDIISDYGLVELDANLRLSNERYLTTTAFETKEDQEYCLEHIEKALEFSFNKEQFKDYKLIRNLPISFTRKIKMYKEYIKDPKFKVDMINNYLTKYRQEKKRLFNFFDDAIKISSVHSFKG